MPTVSSNEKLSTPSVYPTKAPFPTIIVPDTTSGIPDNEDGLRLEPHASEKVQVEVCSELAFFNQPFDIFNNAGPSCKETQQKLALIHDKNGQPMVFAVSNTGRLHVVFHVNNAIAGWQTSDITPTQNDDSSKVDAFDTLELGDKIHIVVSLESDKHSNISQTVWHATFEKPNLVVDDDLADVAGLPDLQWNEINNGIGDKNITSVLCCPSVSSLAGFYICAGTQTYGKSAATHYILDPALGPNATWRDIVMSGSADSLLALQPVCTGSFRDKTSREVGVASVYRQTDGNEQQVCSVEVLDETSAQRVKTRVLQTGRLGSISSLFSSVNPWGLTDILVAGEFGIGYFESSALERMLGDPILPDIAFKQVVCSEVYKDLFCHLTVFAISDHNELYFIEGKRSKDRKVTFQTPSGLPIRQGVTMMSPQYNAKSNASELLYVSDNGSNGLRHLVRDPVSTLWTEDSLQIKVPPGTPSTLTKVPVYMTSISLSNENGVPVPQGYSVNVTCEPHMHVNCNGRSFLLNGKPTKITTLDASGQIDLTLPVDPLMGSCTIKVELFEFKSKSSASDIICINPAQRVIDGLSSVKSENDLRNARGPNGEVIFEDESKITESGTLLTQFGPMARKLGDEDPTSASSGEDDTSTLSWSKEEAAVYRDPDANWFDKASATAGRLLGDAIEYLKIAVKTTVKFAVKTIGKVVMFGLRIAGKVLSFAVKTVAVLLKAVCGILNFMGISTAGLTKWLAVAFSTENAKKTQEVLKESFSTVLDVMQSFLVKNKWRVAEWMEDIEDTCKTVIPDSRPPANDESNRKPSLISRILNNPVIKALMKFNPMSWVLEAMAEGIEEMLGDKLVIPSLDSVFAPFKSLLGDLTDDFAGLLERLFDAIWSELKNLIAHPSKVIEILIRVLGDVFYTAFDTVKVFILACYDAFLAAIQASRDLLTAKWVIPGLTDEWEESKGQDFNLLNCGTYLLAQIMNVTHLFSSSKAELPFDGLKVPKASSIPIPMIETEKLKELASRPPGPHDLVVMMASGTTASPQTPEEIKAEREARLKDRQWCDLWNNVSTVLRFLGGAFDAYITGTEIRKVRDSNSMSGNGGRVPIIGKGVNPPPVAKKTGWTLSNKAKIVPASKGNIELTTIFHGPPHVQPAGTHKIKQAAGDLGPEPELEADLEPDPSPLIQKEAPGPDRSPPIQKEAPGPDPSLPIQKEAPGPVNSGESKEPAVKPGSAASPIKDTHQDAMVESVKKISKIWEVSAIVVNFAGLGFSVTTAVMKSSLPEAKDNIERRFRYANLGLQLGGCICTTIGMCTDMKRVSQGGGIALQIGAVLEWVGTIWQRNNDLPEGSTALDLAKSISGIEYADMAGCGFGLIAAAISWKPSRKYYAVLFSVLDLTSAGSVFVVGFINLEENAETAELAWEEKQKRNKED
ncbi:hypothetical protein P153DRAFT_427689 [Dothidotthia symphoricarpi CBS 119687]|uniref:Uncharacterized protein n=1 Tax=Dothidotthia symphoricarpi CBS 119687 TaxID=1392245 RepID=A0A6A6AS58_9PLEO|nr:uncharacterized protein P153DRAFT_427689 [Dothidotthia symphoricarpi CBS 119687]KAF2133764.1 hypothetical protein P153DRAFT_427689 [Dothidotthia symphoricarpi CBS 119687]